MIGVGKMRYRKFDVDKELRKIKFKREKEKWIKIC